MILQQDAGRKAGGIELSVPHCVYALDTPRTSQMSHRRGSARIAWNASREARRALTDALPLLKAAQSVSVVVVDPQDNPSHGEEPGADIAQHLCRHGVNARVEQLKSNGLAVADVIRNAAMAANHDLIVLGAYSHSRSRELFFGGVTRSLLKDILVPTLIAH